MSRALDKYLDQVMIYANRKPDDAPAIRAELRDHLLTKVEDLKAQGIPPEDAVFQAIEDTGPAKKVGYGLRPRFPLIDVRQQGTARGVIAVGPKAVGIIACGGAAMGVVSYGGFAMGLLSVGGIAAGLLIGSGGIAFAPIGLAYGGLVLGMLALGGMAFGLVAIGGTAVGFWAAGVSGWSAHPMAEIPEPFKTMMDTVQPHQAAAGMIFLGVFILVFALTQWAVWREYRRIRIADPTLAEA